MICACEMGAGMAWMMALPALFLVALMIGGIAIARAVWNRGGQSSDNASSAVSLLEERYARGEIDADEFKQRREHLVERER